MEPRASILVVDDEVNIKNALAKILERKGYQVATSSSGSEALELLKTQDVQVAITDLKMAGLDGMALLKAIKASRPEVEVILITAYGTVESAVEAMKSGAYDYLTKPIDTARLLILVEKALEKQRMGMENLHLRQQLQIRETFEYIVGKSPAMRRVYESVEQVADTNATVLLQGESGTGKELIARAIHQRSSRRAQAFVAINCGALPETLLESELFGYEKGAFTGATSAKKGRFELADGGTLFLDEIGEMSPRNQVSLLRVLETREFRRLGGTQLIKVDLRVIAASNKDLEQRVREGSFREDLYYRLNVMPIYLPPLRERQEDISLLIEAFMRELARVYGKEEKEIAPETMKLLLRYRWPGNVRELRNVVERLIITVREQRILPDHLPAEIQESARSERTITLPLGRPIRELEREIIRRTLQEVIGHREQAAKLLGISPRALYYKMKQFKI